MCEKKIELIIYLLQDEEILQDVKFSGFFFFWGKIEFG